MNNFGNFPGTFGTFGRKIVIFNRKIKKETSVLFQLLIQPEGKIKVSKCRKFKLKKLFCVSKITYHRDG